MTREEAKEKLKKVIDYIIGSKVSADVLFIDNIFDDFESRTCENCKYGNDLDLSLLSCTSMSPQTPSFCPIDFGCNKFIRKEEEL